MHHAKIASRGVRASFSDARRVCPPHETTEQMSGHSYACCANTKANKWPRGFSQWAAVLCGRKDAHPLKSLHTQARSPEADKSSSSSCLHSFLTPLISCPHQGRNFAYESGAREGQCTRTACRSRGTFLFAFYSMRVNTDESACHIRFRMRRGTQLDILRGSDCWPSRHSCSSASVTVNACSLRC